MNESGFRKFFWGFLFFMIDFKLAGFDILPDIVGFILFAMGFNILAAQSTYFQKAIKFNIVMIFVSIFYIYEFPVQEAGMNINPLGILVSIVSLVLSLIIVYNLFMGIKEMAQAQEKRGLFVVAHIRWKQFLILQLATIFTFVLIFIPILLVVCIIALLIAS